MISIVDDAPLAVDDSDSVGEDGPIVADGNVITGAGGSDANADDGVADTPGADGVTLTGIAFNGTAGTVGTPLSGAYGSIVINAEGGYVYTLDPNAPDVQQLDDGETLTETFTYTITDGDGDVATATLTIMINGTNDAPIVSPPGSREMLASVSDEGLPGGIADTEGNPDTTDSATATGAMVVSDPDGDPLTITLGDPGAGFTSGGNLILWSGNRHRHLDRHRRRD